jgi:ABC-type multidrug transport system fused ATPase/permease subunit
MGPRSAIENFGSNDLHNGNKINFNVITRLIAYLQPYRWKMLVALLLTISQSGLTLLSPYLIKIAIDQYITPKHIDGLMTIGIQIGVSFLLLFIVSAGQQYLISWVGQRVLATLRNDLFCHLQRIHLGYHDKHIVGVTVSRVINDVAEINELLSQGVITLIGDLLVLIGIIIVMFSMSPQLALLTFIVLPLMFFSTWLFSRYARLAFRDTRTKVAAVVGDLAEDINGMRAIQAFTQEKASQDRFSEINKENRKAYIKAMSLSFIFLPSIEFLGMLSTVIVLLFGGQFVLNGQVTLGVMVAFLSYVSRFFQPVQELSRMYTTFQSAVAGGEQVLQLLDTALEIKDAKGAIDLAIVKGKVEFKNVSFQYNNDAPFVLNDINLIIQPGQTVAIVGPTGAGKTTIANLIVRFYEVSQGSIKIDDTDIRQVTQNSLRRQVRVISQDPFLFSRTIKENICYGVPDASDQAVIEAAKKANADEFIRSLPEGYDTKILEGGVNISYGQRQLIGIARAFLTDPRILIMDEATANIDTVTEILIQKALTNLLKGRTAIIIAHRLSTVRNADCIYVLDQGIIIDQGNHNKLIREKGLYFDLYERQFMDEKS